MRSYFAGIFFLFLLAGGVFFVPTSFASSGKTEWVNIIRKDDASTNTGNTEKKTNISSWKVLEKDDNSDEEALDSEEEEKIKQDINTYIVESYKAQWTKIIKDLSMKLSKTLPDLDERKEAYKKIRSSLELRKNKTEKAKISDTKKMILIEFLDHMINLLDTKIEEIEK